MRPKGWIISTVILLALAPMVARATEAGRTQWKLGTFTWVKRVPAEPGATPNAHPATLSDGAIQAILSPIQASVENQDIPLFAKDELAGLTKALREAFSLAKPGEDLILLSTHKRGGGLLEVPLGLTARLFVQNGALNLILHDARLSFMDRYLANDKTPEFTYGSRTVASTAQVRAAGASNLRSDWLALPLMAMPVAAPMIAPAPAPAPEPPLGPKDAAFFEAQTLRLKALKRLREENLLSEAEYQEKREAILKTL